MYILLAIVSEYQNPAHNSRKNAMSYKALAPRPAYGSNISEPTKPPHMKKKPSPKIACETCRSRKTACDAKRPACTKCTRKLLPCRYNSTGERLKQRVQDLQSSLDHHRDLINLLYETPEENIIQVMRDLRAAPAPLAYLASARGDLDITLRERRPSTDTSTAGSLQSQPRGDLECEEVTARYEIAYPALAPIPLSTIDLQPRFAIPTSKPGLDQPLSTFEGSVSSSQTTLLQTQPGTTNPLSNLTATLIARLRPSHQQDSTLPFGSEAASIYADDRLHRLQIDYWTSVPISNEFAATVISIYLEVDHPFYGLFDADLFLTDLVNREITFCSPFLVSTLLSQTCYACSAIDVRTLALAHAFFQEAEMLYRAERMSDILPNSSALAIFSIVCSLQCREDLAFETQQLCRQMAKRMKLIGAADEDANRAHFSIMTPQMKVASAQVAWGLYNWMSLRTLFYEDKAISCPPILPIPGSPPEGRHQRTPDLVWPPHSLPRWMGCAFPALCTLWVLAQEIASVYFIDRGKPLIERVSLAFAESKYHRLLEWAATLKPELKRREQNTPIDTLIFHMYLHTIILTIFRPFLLGPQRDQKLRIFTSADSSPGTIYEASITQMKQIVLQHHLDYPGKLFPNFAFAGYIHLCSAIAGTASSINSNAMNKSQRREQQFYFDICMCHFLNAYLQHELALPVAQGLLYMALQSNLIRASKARKILNQFQERGEHHQHYSSLLLDPKMTRLSSPYTSTTATPPNMRAQIIINFELAVTDVGAAQAHSLVSKLEDSVLFEEFTNTMTMDTDSDDTSESSGDEEKNCQQNETENHHERSKQGAGDPVMGSSDYYWTPASDMCRDIDKC
ncbi:conidial development fluffy [Apiospora arundinis]|uniref:Conidial development fluffy n=1 Tax=Apiospora arundinis TaxID=335852 RepID=A0ABR2IWS1_9PEZI